MASLFEGFDIVGSALAAESKRLNVVASNMANAGSVYGADRKPYQAKQVVFETLPLGEKGVAGVVASDVVLDLRPFREVYDPGHPLANEKGYVTQSNVDIVEEMVNMISASQSISANIEMFNTQKSMIQKMLSIVQR